MKFLTPAIRLAAHSNGADIAPLVTKRLIEGAAGWAGAMPPELFSSPATPTAVEIAAWIGGLFFLVAGWNQVERFFDRRAQRGPTREIQPQPLAITKFDRPVPESLCRSRHREVSNDILRLEQEIGSLRVERRTEVGELQQKINKVDREVGELRASIELNNQQLMRIDAKLDRVIERQTP